MKFLRLRLQGFKSFVDPTEILIEPGLTGVVGPNGCGKSNLLEAVRWVMGESSARAMRGDGMDDVIFAGSAMRPPRAHAEVAVSLDNSDLSAPPGFNDSETLEIARRIAREIGSSYRVNGKEARARDVRMIFADAATGANSPSLVRQGRISELVNAKPAARRVILEEAAGVSGLHQRRREAELKLDAAARNMARLEEVLGGLDQRLEQLARQAKQAARYRTISQALRRAEMAALALRWKAASEQAQASDSALTEAVRALAQAQGAAREAARAREAAAEALPPIREEAQISEAMLARSRIEAETLARRAEEAAAALSAARARLDQLQRDRGREDQLNADAAESLARLDDELASLARRSEGHDAALADAERAAGEAGQRLAAREAENDAAGAEAAERAAQAQAARRRAGEAAQALSRARQSAAEAARARAQIEAGLDDLAAAAERAAAGAGQATAAAAAAETRAEADEASRAEAARVEAEARARAAEAEAARAAARAEASALEKAARRPTKRDAPMLDALRVAPGYEAALGAALGDDLDAPERDWRALDPLASDHPPAGAEPLAPQVQAPASLARRLARIAVAAGAEGAALQASLAPGWRLVSRAGDLWRWDGFHRPAGAAPDEAARLLETRNRLAAAQAALEQAETEAAEGAAAHGDARAALEAAEAAARESRAARRAAESAAVEAERLAARAASSRESALARLETSRAAEAQAQERLTAAEAESQAAEAAKAEAGDPDAARARADQARRAVDQARADAQGARRAVEELQRAEAGRARRRENAGREREGWRKRLSAAETRAGEFDARIAAAQAEIAELRAAPDAIAVDREKLAATLETLEARRKSASDALAQAETAQRETDSAERAAAAAASAAAEARAGAEARAESARQREAETLQALRESEPAGPEAALEKLGDTPPADAEAADIEIAKLTRQRDALGAVNLRAEQDAEEVAQERGGLAAEREDLEQAIAKLRQGVSELNREGRARLLEAFDAVDAQFGALFTHLFGGGEARLALVESDDPLEAGLEIMAMPPGKTLARLSLLSGGEQTLTALALIFAVFLVNPAPICVLDEVDAPLDDANVGRYCDLLDEMTRRADTRFLVITHHAVTMSRMNRLYGVTMVEQGVSQLVSVDLALAAEMASA